MYMHSLALILLDYVLCAKCTGCGNAVAEGTSRFILTKSADLHVIDNFNMDGNS